MQVLDIDVFLSYKSDENVKNLDENKLKELNDLFGTSEKTKKKKYVKKSNVNILKNQKIQSKKENIVNKVNLILNKLSESNIDNLIYEFVENINQVDEETYNDIQKTIYLKVLSEINFSKIYLQFLKILNHVYNKVQNYNLKHLISIIETKFKLDYTNLDIEPDTKLDFIKELNGETKRINNLMFIKILVENNIISSELINECDVTIINQDAFLPDIYHWFNTKNRNLTNEEIQKIKTLLTKKNITQREIVLLDSLLNKNIIKMEQSNIINTINKTNITKTIDITDTIKIEIENIIEEYLLIKSLDDIKYFIEKRCTDALSKNKFCELLIDKYFMLNKEMSNDVVILIKELVKSQSLFKSNVSRGLVMIKNNWKDKQIDYNNSTERMKQLLTTLKNIGITKGIEKLIDEYKI